MNYDLILLVAFYLILLIIFKIYRKKFEVQWGIFALYKTKIGLKLMDKIAKKYPRLLNFLSYVSITLGFLGMILTLIFLAKGALSFLTPTPTPQIAPVLPGIKVEGMPVLSFWHWIISILIVAVVHEFCHGIYSRLIKVKIKSSGFAFMGPILAAFVEPDEKQLSKKKTKEQLAVLSAGPFSNIVLSIIAILVLSLVIGPLTSQMFTTQGVQISGLNESFPISKTGITTGEVIEYINGVKIDQTTKLKDVLNEYSPGETVKIKTDKQTIDVQLGADPLDIAKPALGIVISGYKLIPKQGLEIASKVYSWFALLILWIFTISLGVGLFNLLPLGPVDGGRMFYVTALHYTKNSAKAMKLLKAATLLVLFLILVNMWPFITKLFNAIIKLIF